MGATVRIQTGVHTHLMTIKGIKTAWHFGDLYSGMMIIAQIVTVVTFVVEKVHVYDEMLLYP